MTALSIGLVDYGAGNCASVRNTLNRLGLRTRLLKEKADFNQVALILIPGVGAFPSAMSALKTLDLVDTIKEHALKGLPLLGVCLGMQLLADSSDELGYTQGLGLIPGAVKSIGPLGCHIGWNALTVTQKNSSLYKSDGDTFYFNHSFEFVAPEQYVAGIADIGRPLVSVVRKDNICGFQFHPEKSQAAGLALMARTIKELLYA